MEGETQSGAADTEFGAVLEDCGANAFVLEEGAVGGVQVLEVDEAPADFQDAVVARDFGVVKGQVGAFATDDDAGLVEGEAEPLVGAIGDGDDDVGVGGEEEIVGGGEAEVSGGGVRAGEGGHWGDDHGFVNAFFDLDDGGFATFSATELNFAVFGQNGVVQEMLLATMDTTGLHKSKVARGREAGDESRGAGCGKG